MTIETEKKPSEDAKESSETVKVIERQKYSSGQKNYKKVYTDAKN